MQIYVKKEEKKTERAVSRKKTDKKAVSPNGTDISDNRKTQFGNLSGFPSGDMHEHYNFKEPLQLCQEHVGAKQKNCAAKRSGRPVTQLARAENPFKHGDDITSHHIIPYELITGLLEKLDGGKKREVAANALPDFDNINIKKLMLGAIIVKRDNVTLTQVDLVGKLSDNFGKMDIGLKERLTFCLSGENYTYLQFSTGYAQYRVNPLPEFDLDNLATCFFEWQGGNLFQGPKRAEAMPSDKFDVDAHYFYGKDYEKRLKDLYDKMAAEKEKDPVDKAKIVSLLKEMTGITRNIIPPKYNPKKYIVIKNQIHIDLLKSAVEDGRKSHLAVGSSVPVEEANKMANLYTGDMLYRSWITYYEQNLVRGKNGKIEPTFIYKNLCIEVEKDFTIGKNLYKVKFDNDFIEIEQTNIRNKQRGFLFQLKKFIADLNQNPA